MNKIDELKKQLEDFQRKRESLLATLNSLKGQKSQLELQKKELISELKSVGCNTSKELDDKLVVMEKEIAEFTVDLPEELLEQL